MCQKQSANCPFCQVRPEAIFAESKNFLALYNIAPILPGHSLVVPKYHAETIMELERPLVGELMIFSRDVATLLGRAFNTTGFNYTIQEKEEAGQTIPHLHMHVIPRKPKDLPQPGDWYPLLQKSQSEVIDSDKRPRLTLEQIHKIVSHIKQFAVGS